MKNIKIVKSITNKDCDSLSIYFKDIYKYKPLTQEEEIALAKEHTPQSLDKLIKHNLRFVITVAKQYQGQGLSLEDLIMEGNIGICKAAEKFDPDKGYKFISYAVWWIRQSIIAAIYTNSKTIKTPISFISLYQRLNKEMIDFYNKEGRQPSYSELSDKLDLPEEKISELMGRYSKCVSLDTPISDDSETSTLIDVVENKDSILPDNNIIEESKSKVLSGILNKLSKRESFIIKEHFGLFGAYPKSFEEIGKSIGLTGERVRQIKNTAIKKLKERYSSQLKYLTE